MTKNEAATVGAEMGKKAFAAGCMRAPAMDPAMASALAPFSFTMDDDRMAQKSRMQTALMTGWLRGWTAASLVAR